MGVRVLRDHDSNMSALYCSTSGFAFGPIFYDVDEADDFLDWMRETGKRDARLYSDADMSELVHRWRESKGE